MSFEQFDRRREHIDLTPAISIAPWGKFAFNKPASDFLKKKGIKYIVLLFDSDNLTIGIKESKGINDACHHLSDSQHHNYLGFTAIAFFKHIRCTIKRTKSFPLVWDEKEEMYILSLPKEAFS